MCTKLFEVFLHKISREVLSAVPQSFDEILHSGVFSPRLHPLSDELPHLLLQVTAVLLLYAFQLSVQKSKLSSKLTPLFTQMFNNYFSCNVYFFYKKRDTESIWIRLESE